MTVPDPLLMCFGTSEVIPSPQSMVVGHMSFCVDIDGLRNLCWKGREVIRAISWPVRDEDWGTMRPTLISEKTEQSASNLHHQLHFQVGKGALDCQVSIRCQGDGVLQASIEMQAPEDFATNRAGFTVLHPITDLAGSQLQVTHSDGSVENTHFPDRISPDQPVSDIAGLHHQLHGIDIDIRFDGEVFEMEDQRNWSDASFKTYCVPLVQPFTYIIKADSTLRQSIRVKLSGGDASSHASTDATRMSLTQLHGCAPQIGLASDPQWLVTPDTQALIARCAVQYILARLVLTDESRLTLPHSWIESDELEIDLEIVLGKDTPLTELTRLAGQLEKSTIQPSHVVALPEPYLASHQPVGPWPEGPTPHETLKATMAAFPDTAIGCGVLTNFTELNRCPPEDSSGAYVTYGNTAIVHAADDVSVMQTLEALPQIFASAEALSHSLPTRLGLVSLGARTNPYGSAPAANPEQSRKALAQADPRQRGLFAAAWAVGVLSASNEQAIEAITLAAAAGPFGLVWQPQAYPQPWFDDEPDARLFPLFHVIRAAAGMSGHGRIAVDGLPAGAVAYGVRTDEEFRLLLANTSSAPQTLTLDRAWHIRILDNQSFTEAARDPDWLMNTSAQYRDSLNLQSLAIAVLTRSLNPTDSSPDSSPGQDN
ncbi:hypothetical protein ACUNV4_21330 [Granulosicoccus sp. 3-233]|uniref:hypothetical protein n=1 Tax=Granulosicoccus sp. 3-233 TaxID=3417969 RepID=UPI003D349A46